MTMRLCVLAATVLAILGFALTDRAGACSCAAIEPEERLKQVDAAVIGTVISDDGRRGRIRVEHDFKVDLGEEVVVPTSGEGPACGLDLEPGRRIGLFLTREDGRWTSSLCDTVDPDDLPGAEQRLPPPLGEGTAVLLAYGGFSAGRVAALDAEGRPLAYGAGRGRAGELHVCPGSQHAVEVVERGRRVWIAVRRLRDLAVVRERRSPWRGFPSEIACRDPEGRRLVAVVGRHGSARVVALEEGRVRTLHRGPLTQAEFAGDHAMLAGKRGVSLLDLATGRVRRLPRVRADSEQWAVSPDGRRAAGISPGFDRRDHEGALTVVRLSGPPRTVVRPLPGSFLFEGTVMWLDDDRLLLGGGGSPLRLYDGGLRPLRTYASRLEPVLLVLTGGSVYGVADGLHVAEGPDFAVRVPTRMPAGGLSSLAAVPGGVQVDVTP
jgi:hypothetical protein